MIKAASKHDELWETAQCFVFFHASQNHFPCRSSTLTLHPVEYKTYNDPESLASDNYYQYISKE